MNNLPMFLHLNKVNTSFSQFLQCYNLFWLQRITLFFILLLSSLYGTLSQTNNWTPYGALPTYPCESQGLGWQRWDGRVGIRIPDNGYPNNYLPAEPLHIHSGMCTNETNQASSFLPAVLRLQTEEFNDGLGKSEIQFWSGRYTAGTGIPKDWLVSSIKPISNGGAFNPNTNLSNWLGGMAFYCSGINPRPLWGSEIEVMRLYDRRVAINTQTALGVFDVVTSPISFPNRIVFSDGNAGQCNAGPHIKMYRLSGNPPYTEWSSAYPLWLSYETQAPPELGYAQFQIRGNTMTPPVTVGNETPSSMKPLFTLLTKNGNVGLNEPNPDVRLQVQDGSVVFLGDIGNTPRKWTSTPNPAQPCFLNWTASEIDAGVRFMWIPSKKAIRAGGLEADSYYLGAPQYWRSNNIGDYSAAFGLNVRASGNYSLAVGITNRAGSGTGETYHGAIALGHSCFATGMDNLAAGHFSEAHGQSSISMGNQCLAKSSFSVALGDEATAGDGGSDPHSVAIGFKVRTTEPNSMAIGVGIDASPVLEDMVNDIPNSLAIGFRSKAPSFFVGDGDNLGDLGKVGICTKWPSGALSVHTGASGGVVIGNNWISPSNYSFSPIFAFPAGANCDLAVENRVGIGTTSPSCTLGVNGTACIGWAGDGAIPAIQGSNPISMIVENTVVIGGSGTPASPSYVTSGARSGYTSKLQVWGDAIKFQSTPEWDIPSDARYKKDVRPFSDGLSLLKKINPVRFRYDERLGIHQDRDGIGVLAQDMQNILPYTVREDTLVTAVRIKEERRYQVDYIDTLVIKVPDYAHLDEHSHPEMRDSLIITPKQRWAISPAEFRNESAQLLTYNPSSLTYVIVNSIKELDSAKSAENSELREEIGLLQNTNDSLKLILRTTEERLARLEAKNEIALNEAADIILEQNNPNPFADNTIITYYIPLAVLGTPELIITPSSQSQILQTMALTKGLPQQLTVSASGFDTGVYVYSIVVQGKVLASKKFIVIK